MTKANDARIKRSQERAALRLKQAGLELERAQRAFSDEQRALRAERTETIALLRLYAERYGDLDWEDALALPEILEQHLFDPLERTLQKVTLRLERFKAEAQTARDAMRTLGTRTQDAPAVQEIPPEIPRPRPGPRPRLQAVPEVVHRPLVVAAQLRDQYGYVVRCTCGWASPLTSSQASARALAGEHCGVVPERQQSAR